MYNLPPLLQPRAGTSVLATLSDSGGSTEAYPLISWQRYGTGKCMLIATDQLWRLRFRTGDKYHWRVWSQCIQFLTLSRLMGEHKRIRIETDRVNYPEREQVRIYAEVLDDGYQPVLQERYNVLVTTCNNDDLNKSVVTLRPDSTRPGMYEGYFSPPIATRYRIQAEDDDLKIANSVEFQVATNNLEMDSTDMQIERLERIANLSGGNCLRFSQIRDLSNSLNKEPQQIVIRRELPIWNNWGIVLLIIGLAGLEWIVRRRCDLL